MSRFFTSKLSRLVPYTPGEQPRDMQYIKLNTNESPFPPSRNVNEAVEREASRLQLYCDPMCTELTDLLAKRYGVDFDEVLTTNGSDEILNFAFMAFSDREHPITFADITYGFYTVFADLNSIPYEIIPLKDDFSIDINDYIGINKNIVIANPNAPTGRYIEKSDIEKIVKSNPNNVVIVDEAYIDFGGESAASLIKKYDNLLVTGTFSKSRSLAGGRLGFGIGCKALIADLNTIKYSTNPYNVNRLTQVAGVAALQNDDYYMQNCKTIIENRELTTSELTKRGFEVIPSMANFVFAKSNKIDGGELYRELKKRGVLVRHFDKEKIKDYNRITIGTREQMHALFNAIDEVLEK